MTIRIVADEQVICDCTGDTSNKYQDRLLVGIVRSEDSVTIQLYCPKCSSSQRYVVRAGLVLEPDGTLP